MMPQQPGRPTFDSTSPPSDHERQMQALEDLSRRVQLIEVAVGRTQNIVYLLGGIAAAWLIGRVF